MRWWRVIFSFSTGGVRSRHRVPGRRHQGSAGTGGTPLPVLAVVPLFPWIVGWGGAEPVPVPGRTPAALQTVSASVVTAGIGVELVGRAEVGGVRTGAWVRSVGWPSHRGSGRGRHVLAAGLPGGDTAPQSRNDDRKPCGTVPDSWDSQWRPPCGPLRSRRSRAPSPVR